MIKIGGENVEDLDREVEVEEVNITRKDLVLNTRNTKNTSLTEDTGVRKETQNIVKRGIDLDLARSVKEEKNGLENITQRKVIPVQSLNESLNLQEMKSLEQKKTVQIVLICKL